MPKTKDPEMEQFEKDLLQSIGEMKRGEHAAVHTPAQLEARKRGRPAGSVKVSPKIATTIRLDADVLEALKESGPGWQTRANDALREFVIEEQGATIKLKNETIRVRASNGLGYAPVLLDITELQQKIEMLDTMRGQFAQTTEESISALKKAFGMVGVPIKKRKHEPTA